MKTQSCKAHAFAYFFLLSINSIYAQLQVTLKSPENNHRFTASEIFTLSWGTPDAPDNVSRSFVITVVPIHPGQSPQQALADNEPFLRFEEPASTANYDRSREFSTTHPAADTWYAWQITADFPSIPATGESEIRTFFGPKSVPSFSALVQGVTVDSIINADLNNFSGLGRTRFSSNPDRWTRFSFEGLKIAKNDLFYVLQAGEIIIDTVDLSIDMTPMHDYVSSTAFHYNKYRIDNGGFAVFGKASIPAPKGTHWANEVSSDSSWVNFNSLSLNGTLPLPENLLLHPDNAPEFGFSTDFIANHISLYNNQYWYTLSGHFNIPTNESNDYVLPVNDIENFEDLISVTNAGVSRKIQNTGISVQVDNLVLDLDQDSSTVESGKDPSWIGLSFDNASLHLDNQLDSVTNHIVLSQDINIPLSSVKGSIAQKKWSFDVNYQMTIGQARLQVYDFSITKLHVTAMDDEISGELLGGVYVPAVSEELSTQIAVGNHGLDTCHVTQPGTQTMVPFTTPFLAPAEEITFQKATIKWFADSLATAYKVSVSDDGFASVLNGFSKLDAGTDTLFTIEGLHGETEYWYKVEALHANGETTTSIFGKITTEITPPVTGVDEQIDQAFAVAPNPFTNEFRIVHNALDKGSDRFDMMIYNVTGQLLHERRATTLSGVNEVANSQFTFYRPGVYMLQLITSSGETHNIRVVKK